MSTSLYVLNEQPDSEQSPPPRAAGRSGTRGESFGDTLRVSSVTAACYSVGHFLNDACASLWFSYLLFYLEYAQKLSPPEVGVPGA